MSESRPGECGPRGRRRRRPRPGPAPPPPGVAGGGRRAHPGAPRPPNCASRRLQVLVQELEQYQVCASWRPPRPPRRVPSCPLPTPPGPLAQLPSPPPPPPARSPARPRAVVTRVRLVPLQLLPKRLDWEGNEHNRSYEELVRFLTFPSRVSEHPLSAPLSGLLLLGRSGRAVLGGDPGRAGLLGRFCFVLGRPCLFWEETAQAGVGGLAAAGRWGRPCAPVCGGVGPQVLLPLVSAGGRACARAGLQPLSELLSSFCFRTRLVTRPLIGLPSFAPPSSSNHLFPRNRIVAF